MCGCEKRVKDSGRAKTHRVYQLFVFVQADTLKTCRGCRLSPNLLGVAEYFGEIHKMRRSIAFSRLLTGKCCTNPHKVDRWLSLE